MQLKYNSSRRHEPYSAVSTAMLQECVTQKQASKQANKQYNIWLADLPSTVNYKYYR
jgi:hypothetical protein